MDQYIKSEFLRKSEKVISNLVNKLNTFGGTNISEELGEDNELYMKTYSRPPYESLTSIYKSITNILIEDLTVNDLFDLSDKKSFNLRSMLIKIHKKYSNTKNFKLMRDEGLNFEALYQLNMHFHDIDSLLFINKIFSRNNSLFDQEFIYDMSTALLYAMAPLKKKHVIKADYTYLSGKKESFNDFLFTMYYCKLFNLDFKNPSNYAFLLNKCNIKQFKEDMDFNQEYLRESLKWQEALRKGFVQGIGALDSKNKDKIIYCYNTYLTNEQRSNLQKKRQKSMKTADDQENLNYIFYNNTDEFHIKLFSIYKQIILEMYTLEQYKAFLEDLSWLSWPLSD